jgi:peptidoglycan/xylan/chitin deacetylase (PgdA/CDA1 family)
VKRRLKAILGSLAYRSGIYRRFFADKAVIALFHRVDDEWKGNPISSTREEFTAYCDFFRRYFIVVSLAELLRKIEAKEDITRHLVITFDDGYKDNHDFAAVELRKRDMSATFFVATNFISSDRVPWWDADSPIRPKWMNWDDVRSLRDQGFAIGSHTEDHVDMGVVARDEALAQLVGSRKKLASELGTDPEFFAYPYGRANQMSETNRSAVAEAGYRCCLSAFGGAVGPETRPLYIKRISLSPWFVSPYHFAFEAMLERP